MRAQGLVAMLMWGIVCSTQAATIEIGPNGCSLADAIRSANDDEAVGLCAGGSGTDTIIAPDGWTIPLSNQLPVITSDLTITTQTPSGMLTLSGQESSAIMRVSGAATNLTIQRVVFEDGKRSTPLVGGAALRITDATVVIEDSEFHANVVNDARGGAIRVEGGSLTLVRSWLRNNRAKLLGSSGRGTIDLISAGGAIAAFDSVLDLREVWFEKNFAEIRGRSVFMQGGTMTLKQSAFDDIFDSINADSAALIIENTTLGDYSRPPSTNVLIVNNGTVDLNHVTMSAEMRFTNTTVTATNSILAPCELNNSSFVLFTHNIVWSNYSLQSGVSCVESVQTFDLLPISDNGGSTPTRALFDDSIARNAGSPAYCTATDQRGEVRDSACDIGAFEAEGFADVSAELLLQPGQPYVSGQEISGLAIVENLAVGTATWVEVDIAADHFFITDVYSGLCPSFPCTIAQINAGDTVEIPFSAVLDDYTQSPFNAELSASSTGLSTHIDVNEGGPNDNNTAQVTNTIHPGADLTLEIVPTTPPPYALSQSMKYQASITNHGPQNANDLEWIVVPDGLSNISFEDCDSVVGNTCTVNQVPHGSTKLVSVSGDISASEFDLTGLVGATEVDIFDDDNSDSTGNQGAVSDTDVSVTMELQQMAPFYSFTYMEFDVRVKTSEAPATNINISSDMPGATYIQFCGSGECFVPSMTANDHYDLSISMFAPVSAYGLDPDIWTHTVYVQPAQTDSNPANNTAVMSDDLYPTADVALDVTLLTDPPYYVGEAVAYEISFVNGGLNHATNVRLDNDLDNLQLLSVNGSACDALNCSLAQMDFAQRETMVAQFSIQEAGPFNLGTKAIADEYDENSANNLDLINGDTATLAPLEVIYAGSFEAF